MYPSSRIFNLVKVVATHTVQCYCEILMEAKNLNNAQGKQLIYEIAKSYVTKNNRYASSYIGIVKKMEKTGFEEFSFRELDLTALKSILLYNGEKLGYLPDDVWHSLNALVDYKNDDSHDSTNQPIEDALTWADRAMVQISYFISCVEKDSEIPESSRQRFASESRAELAQLPSEIRELHDEDFREKREIERSMERDVADAIRARNLGESANSLIEKWHKRLTGSSHYLSAWVYLTELLLEKGIPQNGTFLAEAYFDGTGVDKDFNKALRYFNLVNAEDLHVKALIKKASIHLNGLAEKSSVEEGKRLLEECCKKDGGAAEIAYSYYHGRYLNQDYEKALFYYDRVDADKLDSSDLIHMASLHLNGLIASPSNEIGERLLAKCAETKSGSIALGNAFFSGDVLEKSYEKAAAYYEKHSPYPPTLNIALNLASIYVNGLSSNSSKKDGLKLLENCRGHEGEVVRGRQIEIIEYLTDEGILFYTSNMPLYKVEKPISVID